MSNIAAEFKAKKAKFGFNLGSLSIQNVVEVGAFVSALAIEFDENEYKIEESGWNPSTVVKVYTEKDEVADFIRNYKP